MSIQRFFIKDLPPNPDVIIFPPDIAHQIAHVLRCEAGETVVVLNGDGKAYHVELNELDGKSIRGKVILAGEERFRAAHEIHLYFPLSKKEKVEWILQKGTEVGVSAFHPFISQRSLIQKIDLKPSKITRWEAIIREAAEQSGRIFLPRLKCPIDLGKLIENEMIMMDASFVASIDEAFPFRDALLPLVKNQKEDGRLKIALFTGPEGGFGPDEVDSLRKLGCTTVSLGAHILRMETAAIVMPAIITHLIG